MFSSTLQPNAAILELLNGPALPVFTGGLVHVSALTAVVYDALICLAREREVIWERKSDAGSWVYLLNRYPTIATCLYYVALDIFYFTRQTCIITASISYILVFLQTVSRAVFTSLRVYAICNRNLRVAALVLVASVVVVVVEVSLVVISMTDGVHIMDCTERLPAVFYKLSPVSMAINLAVNLIVLTVTWVKTWTIRRQARQLHMDVPISSLLLRDGTAHFFLFLLLEVGEIVFTRKHATQGMGYLTIYTYVFANLTVCHFILHLRMVYLNRTSIASNRSFRFSLLHLTDSLVGNLGAPLQLDTMSGEEPVQGASSYQSSYDPLASGLLLDPEEGPLLSTSTLSRDSFLETPISSSFYTSPVQVSPLEVNDLFDDTEYGVSILSVMHRGDTEMKEREKGSVGSGVDDSEICDLLERDRERFTTSFVEA